MRRTLLVSGSVFSESTSVDLKAVRGLACGESLTGQCCASTCAADERPLTFTSEVSLWQFLHARDTEEKVRSA